MCFSTLSIIDFLSPPRFRLVLPHQFNISFHRLTREMAEMLCRLGVFLQLLHDSLEERPNTFIAQSNLLTNFFHCFGLTIL